jgi:hypothetical protein
MPQEPNWIGLKSKLTTSIKYGFLLAAVIWGTSVQSLMSVARFALRWIKVSENFHRKTLRTRYLPKVARSSSSLMIS